jgi:protein-disulfide isomerase
MKAVIIATVVFCLALIGLGIYFSVQTDSSGPRDIPIDPAYTQRVKAGGWVKGATNPKVTVVEYEDFQCPVCGVEYPIVAAAFEATKSYTQLTFREYPLSYHNKSTQAAYAAEAAGRQGKFWQMYQLIYVHQNDWTDQTPSQFASTLESYAQAIQLNMDQYRKDIQDPTIQDVINSDIQQGNNYSYNDNGNILKLTGTPTLIINGKILQNLPQDSASLIQIIQQAAGTSKS